jgi:hypothetical protein
MNTIKKTQDAKVKKKVRLPQLSIEFTSVMFSLMIFTTQNKEELLTVVPAFLMAPGDKERLALLESIIKKNLDQAINFVCLLSLAERLIKQETSARATVSLIYFGYRLMSNQNSENLGNKEYRQLWTEVWSFASQVPSVAAEIREQEENNCLRDWQEEVQVFARRRWRTLRTEQFPRVKEEVDELQKRLADFLRIDLN